jgi:Integrase core domain
VQIERFDRTFRDEVLNACIFDSLDKVREITGAWLPVVIAVYGEGELTR